MERDDEALLLQSREQSFLGECVCVYVPEHVYVAGCVCVLEGGSDSSSHETKRYIMCQFKRL